MHDPEHDCALRPLTMASRGKARPWLVEPGAGPDVELFSGLERESRLRLGSCGSLLCSARLRSDVWLDFSTELLVGDARRRAKRPLDAMQALDSRAPNVPFRLFSVV